MKMHSVKLSIIISINLKNIIYEIKISKDCLIHETEVNKHI